MEVRSLRPIHENIGHIISIGLDIGQWFQQPFVFATFFRANAVAILAFASPGHRLLLLGQRVQLLLITNWIIIQILRFCALERVCMRV